MRYYPINLDLDGKRVVIIGGGVVAARKAGRLIAAGARLTVVSPCLCDRLAALAAAGSLVHIERRYASGDLAGAQIAFAATDDATVNLAVACEARELGILIDLVGAPRQGSFTTPAVLCRGDLMLTVSTSGTSPRLAKRIIAELAPHFGEQYVRALCLLGEIREKILTGKGGSAYTERVFAELAPLELPASVENDLRDALVQGLLSHCALRLRPANSSAEKKETS